MQSTVVVVGKHRCWWIVRKVWITDGVHVLIVDGHILATVWNLLYDNLVTLILNLIIRVKIKHADSVVIFGKLKQLSECHMTTNAHSVRKLEKVFDTFSSWIVFFARVFNGELNKVQFKFTRVRVHWFDKIDTLVSGSIKLWIVGGVYSVHRSH